MQNQIKTTGKSLLNSYAPPLPPSSAPPLPPSSAPPLPPASAPPLPPPLAPVVQSIPPVVKYFNTLQRIYNKYGDSINLPDSVIVVILRAYIHIIYYGLKNPQRLYNKEYRGDILTLMGVLIGYYSLIKAKYGTEFINMNITPNEQLLAEKVSLLYSNIKKLNTTGKNNMSSYNHSYSLNKVLKRSQAISPAPLPPSAPLTPPAPPAPPAPLAFSAPMNPQYIPPVAPLPYQAVNPYSVPPMNPYSVAPMNPSVV
jgi:hypothetical protein